METGERIRQLRLLRGVTLEQVARCVGVSRQTLSRYETGVIRNIPREVLEGIARALGCAPSWLAGWGDAPAAELTAREDLLLRRYRLAEEDDRQIVDAVLRKYAPEDAPPAPPKLIRLYREPYAAGLANPVEGSDYELIELPDGVRADCAVRIQGDSMEPYIHDGSFVFVRQNETLQDGDVGIFYVPGAGAVCKQYCCDAYGNVYLFSLNRRRADADIRIAAGSGMSAYVQGKVVLQQRIPLP